MGKFDRLLQPGQVHCTFDDFVGWAAPQIIFSVRCNSDPERLASFQTVETVLRSSDVLPSVVPKYCHVLNPCWFECFHLSLCNSLTVVENLEATTGIGI